MDDPLDIPSFDNEDLDLASELDSHDQEDYSWY